MVNKKLMTSLFNVRFKLEKEGCTLFKDQDGNILGDPLPQYRYITDRVVHPKKNIHEDFPDLIYAGTNDNDLLAYTCDWSADGTTPWDFNNDTVEKDLELKPCNWVEKKWKIEFNLVATPIAGGNLVIDSACTKEPLPPTIENISNGRTVTSTAANNYASDYTKNKFKYSTTGSDLHYVMRNATGNSCRWVDQYGNDFYFGTTKVYKDLKLHMVWAFKTWALTVDYNTGSNKYYNDLTEDYTIKSGTTSIKTYSKTENATFDIYIEDNFTANTSPGKASTVSYYLDNITSDKFSAGGVSSKVKVNGWYNEMGRSSGFDRDGFKFTTTKTIYAKWVNSAYCARSIATSRSYQSYTKQTDWWNTLSGTYTIPSFCVKLTAEVCGPGGNSSHESGNEATTGEECEVTICNPGGSASRESKDYTASEVSKLSFDYMALGSSGSYSKSYIKKGNWECSSSRGAGAPSKPEHHRYNLGDHDPEVAITNGTSNVVSYFSSMASSGAVLYTNFVTNHSSRSNTYTRTRFRFVGYCNTNWAKQKNRRIEIYVEGYFEDTRPNYSWSKSLSEHVAYMWMSYSGGSDPGWEWNYTRVSKFCRWWPSVDYNSSYYGSGGQCLFFSTGGGYDDEPQQCYGNGGYVTFHFPA